MDPLGVILAGAEAGNEVCVKVAEVSEVALEVPGVVFEDVSDQAELLVLALREDDPDVLITKDEPVVEVKEAEAEHDSEHDVIVVESVLDFKVLFRVKVMPSDVEQLEDSVFVMVVSVVIVAEVEVESEVQLEGSSEEKEAKLDKPVKYSGVVFGVSKVDLCELDACEVALFEVASEEKVSGVAVSEVKSVLEVVTGVTISEVTEEELVVSVDSSGSVVLGIVGVAELEKTQEVTDDKLIEEAEVGVSEDITEISEPGVDNSDVWGNMLSLETIVVEPLSHW